MNEVKFLRDQIKTTFEGDTAWHGPSLLKTLEGTSMEEAKSKPLGERHSIWELVDHLAFWNEAVAKAIRIRKMPDPRKVEDWTEMGVTESEWEASVRSLERGVHLLLSELAEWTNEDLEKQVPGAEYSFKQMLHGVVHHNLYHAGQIAILRKKI
jgi:hypothetical protein